MTLFSKRKIDEMNFYLALASSRIMCGTRVTETDMTQRLDWDPDRVTKVAHRLAKKGRITVYMKEDGFGRMYENYEIKMKND